MGAYQSSISEESVKQNRVDFFINGKAYHVDTNFNVKIGPETKLVDFIRNDAGLKGTKYMCRKGGCGACVVTVKSKDPITGKDNIRAVNSCLVPLFGADGWEITTIEGLGDKKRGYSKSQEQIVKFNGSQCGFCTSGMLMNFHGLSQGNPSFKAVDVEDAFDGNICRCTGYRPILDAFKALANDASEELKIKHAEPEEISCPCSNRTKCCKQQQPGMELESLNDEKYVEKVFNDYDTCGNGTQTKLCLQLKSGETWVRATNLGTAFDAVQHFRSSGINYRMVAGNTGGGVYEEGPYLGYVDISNVAELQISTVTGPRVEIGAGVTLNMAIKLFQKASELDGYSYMTQFSKHLKRVANAPVRNAGTLGGNLMLKHNHHEFPSDVFMLLEAVSAKLNIGSSSTVARDYSLVEFRNADMNGKIIISIKFPAYKGGNFYFKSFKITKRYQNSHAIVNAAMLMKVDPKRNYSVRDKPSIVFGGIHPDFVHAIGTEIYFVGKFLNLKTIQGAMISLEKEVQPSIVPTDADPTYRKSLCTALLYKFLIGIMADSVKPSVSSGGLEIERNLMYGKQDFETDKSQWPLYQPIAKIEAKYQASGEAEYINDMGHRFGEIFGAFVLSTVANAKINKIDASEALMIPGVVKFIQAKDVPGVNNAAIFYPEKEEIFATETIKYAGQPIGLILADSQDIAVTAVQKVVVSYTNIKKPILTLKESLHKAKKEGKLDQCTLDLTKSPVPITDVSKKGKSTVVAAHNIKGEFEIGGQYHFHMETQTCLCVPTESGIDVFASTQFPHGVQAIVATTLGISTNCVNVSVRRLGGAFGAKISKATQIACAAAIAAHATNRPVRIVLDLETNMKMIGKRLPYLAQYEVGVLDTGKIVDLNCKIFCDPGCVGNEATAFYAMINLQNCYQAERWEITPGQGLTDTPPNTYCRAPGSTQGIAIIETIIEHIAFTLKMDPLQLRTVNLIKNGDAIVGIPGLKFSGENPIPKLIEDLKSSSEYDTRKDFVDNFNKNNRWKKRGLSLVPMRYPNYYPEFLIRFPVYICVYAADGTVDVSHSGIEMGQGINTKCAQVVSHVLQIPIEKVKVQPTTTLLSPNSGITGAAVTSELICHAAVECCKQLQAKMEPVKATLKNPTWEELVTSCYNEHVLLNAHHQDKVDAVKSYDIWGLTLTEVEVDVLTGEFKIVRVDLLEDAGKSLSPNVDIGQIEGAFVMGLGLWTTEKLIYDKNTGELLTCNTWNYKPPLPRDIPEDFRITMLRNRENPYGVLGSKATGEAPLTMSSGVMFALRNALNSARMDVGNTDWFQMNAPVTSEDIQRYALTSKDQFEI